jgi:uncharacterized membrane protein
MSPSSQAPASAARPAVLAMLVAYPVMAIAGALTHRPMFSLAALLLLLTAALLPRLLSRQLMPWLLWLSLLAALLLLYWYGFAAVLLESIPVLINLLLACWFGSTLTSPEPRVAQIIVAIEGRERLAQPGVAAYARQITWYWTLLLAAQALLLALLLLCATHTGLLASLGIRSPLAVSDRWATAWLHVGGYLLLGVAFALEYAWRRWRLRHLEHAGLPTMLLQLARHWPQLLHGSARLHP